MSFIDFQYREEFFLGEPRKIKKIIRTEFKFIAFKTSRLRHKPRRFLAAKRHLMQSVRPSIKKKRHAHSKYLLTDDKEIFC